MNRFLLVVKVGRMGFVREPGPMQSREDLQQYLACVHSLCCSGHAELRVDLMTPEGPVTLWLPVVDDDETLHAQADPGDVPDVFLLNPGKVGTEDVWVDHTGALRRVKP